MRIPYISLVAAGALTLGGCAYGDFGYGAGYGGYGAYDNGYYGYGPYGGYGQYPGYYGGFGAPYFGWYDDFYYPGSGIFVYDSFRRPHRWSSRERAFWTSRQSANTTHSTNWSGFDKHVMPSTTSNDTRRHRDRD
ncbi:MAG TPA: hypothetical protein VNR68_02650 [Sphingomicrobium sp.]|nr:hypothetical protein [Sphingomicrobium sp.]